MKRIIGLLLIGLLVISGCSSAKTINYIKTTQVMEKMDNKDDFVLIVGSSTCGACIAYKPILEEVVKNKEANIFYVQYDTEGIKADNSVDEAGRANITKLFDEYFGGKITSTPSTLYIKDGKIDSMEAGLMSYVQLIDWLVSHGQPLKQ